MGLIGKITDEALIRKIEELEKRDQAKIKKARKQPKAESKKKKSSMKVLSYNIRGLGNKIKRKEIS